VRGIGFLVLYLSWAAGMGLVVWGARSLIAAPEVERSRALPRRWSQVGLLGLVVATLALPWVRGPAAEDGMPLTLDGFEGLDFLSLWGMVVFLVVLVAYVLQPAGGGAERRLVLCGLSAALVGLAVGNAVVFWTDPNGSRLAWGAPACACAGAALLVSVERSTHRAD
jgi:hypothetical protein